MSFDYGSQQIEIKNPFPLLGRLLLACGGLFLVLGIILFLVISMRGNEIVDGESASKLVLFFHFLGAFILVATGIGSIVKGLFMVNKFYVGRGMPADLAYEITKKRSDYTRNPNSVSFSADHLHKALMNRMNPSYIEPGGLIARMLHSYNPQLLFLPLPLRYITESAFECAAYNAGILILFALSILSGTVGVNEFTSTPMWKYIGWVYVLMMLGVCLSKMPRKKWRFVHKASTVSGVVMLIGVSLLVPVIAGFFDGAKDLAASPLPWLVLIPLLAAGVFAYTYIMALKRLPEEQPKTEVSEFREQWDESINPQEIFRNVDMTLADFRYMEMANRKYRAADTGLISYEKGEYSGTMIQETQPVPMQDVNDESLQCAYKKLCAFTSVVLMALSGVWFFSMIAFAEPASVTFTGTLSGVVGALMLGLFGRVLYKTAYVYYGEIRFRSRLILFFADGTFNKSKISMGMSVYDSMRSENELVQTSIRPWIVCTDITTTTFAVSGHYNLEQYRLILEMEKDDKWLDNIVVTLKKYLKSRKKMASTVSAEDLQSTAQIAQINQIIRNGSVPDEGNTGQIENSSIARIMNDERKDSK